MLAIESNTLVKPTPAANITLRMPPFPPDAAKDHGSQPPIADGQRLGPDGGRVGIKQGERRIGFGRRRGRSEAEGRQSGEPSAGEK